MTTRWYGFAIGVAAAIACAACGDDSAATGSGGSGGGETATSTASGTAPSSSSSGATTSGSNTSGTGGSDCPDDLPARDAACDVDGAVCVYESVEECEGEVGVTDTATCADGAWSIVHDSPCVELESCPADEPDEASPCEPPAEGTCHYEHEETCFDGASTTVEIDFACTNGSWRSQYTGLCCPSVPFQDEAQSCIEEGKVCTYTGDVVCEDGGSIGGAVVTTCESHELRTVYEPTGGVCDGETACPGEPPAPGTGCDPTAATVCIWETASACPDGVGFTIIRTAQCGATTESWAVATLFEGEACAACPENAKGSDCVGFEGMACIESFETTCDDDSGVVYIQNSGRICTDGDWQEVWDDDTCD